jgi:hypothetical protein
MYSPTGYYAVFKPSTRNEAEGWQVLPITSFDSEDEAQVVDSRGLRVTIHMYARRSGHPFSHVTANPNWSVLG